MSGGETTEAKKRKIRDIRKRSKEIIHSATETPEYLALLIEATNDMHDSILELTDMVKKLVAPG